MSNEVWFARSNNALISTDEDSRKVIADLEQGECQCFEPIGVRDEVSFRKYWAMCAHISKHVRQIEIDRVNRQPVQKRVFNREDVSDAIKLGTGLYTDHPVASTEYAIREPKSISYKRMTPAKWAEYIRRVAPFVQMKILPDVRDPDAQDELLRMISGWLSEIEHDGAKERAA